MDRAGNKKEDDLHAHMQVIFLFYGIEL